MYILLPLFLLLSCGNSEPSTEDQVITVETNQPLLVGADIDSLYFPYLESVPNAKVGVVANQTSITRGKHLVDHLLENKINVTMAFAPEHGFRGKANAGAEIDDMVDPATGIPIYSIYGNNRKPKAELMKELDFMVFDIQDVGTRFYTYISTLEYVMEACAENNVKLIVLDRPNPNGHYVAGPVLEKEFRSFVGMQSIPVVHGLTVGEYANMLKGEGWFNQADQLEMEVIPCSGYDHNTFYELPIPPSPNLPDMKSIYLYPSTCFFEATELNEGRGTDKPFQIFGHPSYTDGAEFNITYTPKPNKGSSNPKLNGKECKGWDLSGIAVSELQEMGWNLDYLVNAYEQFSLKEEFFNQDWMGKLSGTNKLMEMIIEGRSSQEIEDYFTDSHEMHQYLDIRKKYLLYPDFE